MNYLAHLWLAGRDPALQLGGLLGDHLKGPLEHIASQWGEELAAGVRLHRHIDAYSDRLPAYRTLKPLFPPALQRYSPVLLDLFWDHVLCQQWPSYHPQALDEFCRDFYRHSSHFAMPDFCRRWLEQMERDQVLQRYGDAAFFHGVLARMEGRLRRPVPLRQAAPLLTQHRQLLLDHGAQVLVQCRDFSRSRRAAGL